MFRRVPDIGKANRYIGFRPTLALKEIVLSVIDYYRKEQNLAIHRP